ncbi:E3 ubiquitin-protein ligase RNF181-like [Lineus longissimus]|uniref:E3 ubiquitin-protein ligase RNF181-like n=1 Tax=Lineus longissimus TaxID=88925 RepID=UPI002B4DDC7D
MTSYFDEHDCEPLKEGERPNELLHLARLLLDTGLAFEDEFSGFFRGEKPPPPASKKVVESLPSILISPTQAATGASCPICLGKYDEEDSVKQLPCKHRFHPTCIMPWLERTNSCPVCRHELPTDDKEYEEFRKHKARKEQRDFDLENLHGSMYG